MYTMTYDSLLQDLRNYIERGFTATSDAQVYEQLPRLITLAERRCARDMKVEGFIKVVGTTLAANVAVYTKPDRWRDTISMRLAGGPIFGRSYEYVRNYWPDESITGTPEFYADYDYQHWLLVPTPAAVAPLEIVYYEQPPFLGESTQTNWLTEYAPDVLLYAALLETMPFLKNDERVGTWQAMYERAAGSLSNEDLKRITDRSSSRNEA